MLAPILASVAGAALVAGLTCITLKTSLVKPSRIVKAGDDTGVYNTLSGVILHLVTAAGPLQQIKKLNLRPEQFAAMGEEAFPPDWIAGEIEAIVYEVSDAIKSGQDVRLELQLEPIKGDIAAAITSVLQANAARVPNCSPGQEPGRSLCKPKGASEFQFQTNVAAIVSRAVDNMPANYPLLTGPAASGMKALQGALGTLGWAGMLFILIAAGAGAAAYMKKDEDSPMLKHAGLGVGLGSLGLIFAVFSGKKAVLGGLGAAISTLEASVAKTLGDFIAAGLGGGFTSALILLGVSFVIGVGMVLMAIQAEG